MEQPAKTQEGMCAYDRMLVLEEIPSLRTLESFLETNENLLGWHDSLKIKIF